LFGANEEWFSVFLRPTYGADLASTESSSLFSVFFLERVFLTHFDVVRSRFVVVSMPNAVGKLPFRAAGDLFLV
jgi:hypothetical protein